MQLKDFEKGKTAFAVQLDRRNGGAKIEPFIVHSVGRKYLKATPCGLGDSPSWERDFVVNENYPDCLIENHSFMDAYFLYPTEAQANAAIEAEMLRRWLREAVEYGKMKKYSLDQLRAVKAILEQENKA